jgi:hypothetical protein
VGMLAIAVAKEKKKFCIITSLITSEISGKAIVAGISWNYIRRIKTTFPLRY